MEQCIYNPDALENLITLYTNHPKMRNIIALAAEEGDPIARQTLRILGIPNFADPDNPANSLVPPVEDREAFFKYIESL